MKKILISISMVAVIATIAVYATRAYFTSSVTSSGNTFTSGTLSLKGAGIVDAATVSIPNMAPGDISQPYTITIENDGSINLGWLGNWQFTGGASSTDSSVDLKDALYIADAQMQFLTPSNQNWLGDTHTGYEDINGIKTDHFITNGVGSGPYPYAAYSPLATLNVFNNNSSMLPGSVYEHEGALRHGYKYQLTVKFGMRADAGNAYQGLSPVTAKLQVNATQINAAALEAEGVPAGSAADTVTWMNNQIADQTE